MRQDHFGYNSVQLGTTQFLPVLKPSKTELYRVIPRIIWSIKIHVKKYILTIHTVNEIVPPVCLFQFTVRLLVKVAKTQGVNKRFI